MGIKPAEKGKRKLSCLPRELREREAVESALIRKSMCKWQRIDEVGRELGRGLGKKELIDRVAQEVGTTLRQVQCALRLSVKNLPV